MYLAITVLATITLYYELYVGGSVSTLLLTNLHMSFTFYVITLAFGAIIGAFGSLFAGITDRLGRANLVVFGLFFTGVFTAFILPAATERWTFTIETFVVGFVEGVCLVATPALIRDFSPQVGRATAMGFWTSGPVLGSLIVSIVGTATIPAVVDDARFWTHEYRICGMAFAQSHPAVVAAAQKVPPSVVAAAQSVPPPVVATAQKIPPDVLAIAQKDATQLANAQKFAPELAVLQAHPALFAKLATFKNPATIPPALLNQAIAAAGGGAKGLTVLGTINANQAAITGVIAVAPDLQKVAPYAADLKTIAPYSAQLTAMAPYSTELTTIAPFGPQLTALSKVPPQVTAYLRAHGAAVQKAATQTAGQWKTWYWICFGGIIFFLFSIPLLRGRWRTRDAKRDEAEHEAKVQEELAKLKALA